MIGLTLFDSRVSYETEKLMLLAMEEASPDHPPKCPRLDSAAFVGKRGLEQFCSSNSKRLFQLLQLPVEFLVKDVSEWEDDDCFKKALETVRVLAVVNDRAERGVALIQDFNWKPTTGEEQLQFLLQVVSEHRRQFPECTKKSIMSTLGSAP